MCNMVWCKVTLLVITFSTLLEILLAHPGHHRERHRIHVPQKIKTIYHTKIIKVPEHHHHIIEKEKKVDIHHHHHEAPIIAHHEHHEDNNKLEYEQTHGYNYDPPKKHFDDFDFKKSDHVNNDDDFLEENHHQIGRGQFNPQGHHDLGHHQYGQQEYGQNDYGQYDHGQNEYGQYDQDFEGHESRKVPKKHKPAANIRKPKPHPQNRRRVKQTRKIIKLR